MAGIAVGARAHARRELNYDLALVPFIDFLLCLVAFLLVTAVWSHHARLQADAKVPGIVGPPSTTPPQELHVLTSARDFELKWMQGSTVVSTLRVPRTPQALPNGNLRYPELERATNDEWKVRGVHRAATDTAQERAVLHTPNSLEFREMTAMLDALHGPTRTVSAGRATVSVPVFAVALATD